MFSASEVTTIWRYTNVYIIIIIIIRLGMTKYPLMGVVRVT